MSGLPFTPLGAVAEHRRRDEGAHDSNCLSSACRPQGPCVDAVQDLEDMAKSADPQYENALVGCLDSVRCLDGSLTIDEAEASDVFAELDAWILDVDQPDPVFEAPPSEDAPPDDLVANGGGAASAAGKSADEAETD